MSYARTQFPVTCVAPLSKSNNRAFSCWALDSLFSLRCCNNHVSSAAERRLRGYARPRYRGDLGYEGKRDRTSQPAEERHRKVEALEMYDEVSDRCVL